MGGGPLDGEGAMGGGPWDFREPREGGEIREGREPWDWSRAFVRGGGPLGGDGGHGKEGKMGSRGNLGGERGL